MIQPQTRRVIDTPDDIEAEAPLFRSRREAAAAPSEARSNALDPLEWQFFDFAGQVGLVASDPVSWMQGYRWGVISTSCGAFVVALFARWVL